MNAPFESEAEDHRVRSGRRKRERMRAHLLESVLSVYPARSLASPAVIDDVIKHAGVSRGTFYKYFDSLEEAVTELATKLADELAEAYATVYEAVEDPRARAAIGFQIYLSRAALDPDWGAFVSHLNYLTRDTSMMARIRADLQAGIHAGVFTISDLDVALDVVIGSMIEGVRHVTQNASPRRYLETMAGMVLRSFGVPGKDADTAVEQAAALLREEGESGQLPWWSPIP